MEAMQVNCTFQGGDGKELVVDEKYLAIQLGKGKR